jgi:hypothetical protein
MSEAVDLDKHQVETSIQQTKARLRRFEEQYQVSTTYFLNHMTAEDLTGGDWEYIEWAGEAKLLQGLETELKDLKLLEDISPLEPGKVYDIPTPYDSYGAAKILMEFLNEQS